MVRFRGAGTRAGRRSCLVCACALALATVPLAAAGGAAGRAAAATVRVEDLGTLGGADSRAVLIGNSGRVVGWSDTPDSASHVFSWTAAGGMVDLGAPDALGDVVGISESGQVAFNRLLSGGGPERAFVWTPGGGTTELGTLGGDYTHAAAMNASGEVAGTSTTDCPTSRAFSWTPMRGMIDLGADGAMGRCPPSGANAISNTGNVAGWTMTAAGSPQAAVAQANGGMNDIGTLDRLGNYSIGSSTAVAVSDSGQVVGRSETPDGSWHAFAWSPAGDMVDLGVDLDTDAPVAINDNGQVVGTTSAGQGFSWTADAGMVDLDGTPVAVDDDGQVVGTSGAHAFMWTPAGGMIDLGTLGGRYSGAVAINDLGQVVGWSETQDGRTHAALWKVSPVVPFASMSASAMVLAPAGAANDSFALNGNFALGDASNGIDPVSEPVTLSLAGNSLTVPSGAMRGVGRGAVFTGKLGGGRLLLSLTPVDEGGSYRLTATGVGYDLSVARLPLTVELTVGDDDGTTSAKAVILPPPR